MIKSDSYLTGKFYQKLDAYILNNKTELEYLCSTNQYKTQKRFKESLRDKLGTTNNIKIRKSQ